MKYKKKFQAPQNPCWHRIRGRAGSSQSSAPAGKGRSGPPSAQGSFLLPFWLLGKTQVPLPCPPAHPGPPPHPWRGRQSTSGCPGDAAAPGQVSQPPPFPKTAALLCSGTAQHPHPHHGKWGTPWMSRGSAARPGRALPILAGLCPCPGLLLGLSSAAPARGAARCPSATRIAKSRAVLYLP